MSDISVQPSMDLLKKLRRKAEVCRFCHSELKEKYVKCKGGKEFSITFLAVILAILIGLYYRGVLKDELTLLIVFILPFVIMTIQSMDCNVFQWTQKLAQHKSAVTIWGGWIREADFLEKHLHRYSGDVVNEKMQYIQEKYSYCMATTEQIPNKKFLKYKKKFKEYILTSQKIDRMSLEDMKNERTSFEKNKAAGVRRTSCLFSRLRGP